MRCLWLARTLPFPLTAGDRIYSCHLAAALAAAGCDVVFMGLKGDASSEPFPRVEWHVVPGGKRSDWLASASILPLVAARHATAAYRAAIKRLTQVGHWDAVVVDYYGMGWAMKFLENLPGRPVRVFVTHNHEESVTRSQWRDTNSSVLRRIHMGQNHFKAKRIERRMTRQFDLVTVITEEDAGLFSDITSGLNTLLLTPGFSGRQVPSRTIDHETPSMVLLFGSYHWSAKQQSLIKFLDVFDEQMALRKIEIRIVGDIPDNFRAAILARYRAIVVTGKVEDPRPHLSAARLAIVAEPIGGGFKLKLLEYVFSRVPIAAIDACASGLPATIRDAMVLAPDLTTLYSRVISTVHNFDLLNDYQNRAYTAAAGLFDWPDRGTALMSAILTCRNASALTRTDDSQG